MIEVVLNITFFTGLFYMVVAIVAGIVLGIREVWKEVRRGEYGAATLFSLVVGFVMLVSSALLYAILIGVK